ncbi:MAG TPA: RNA-binding protein [Candidatus Binatia bacterium]|nr:RNA-binding protein [Candidatus Binatia bacterium]
MNIYVGNLPYTTSEADLRNAFAQYGEVAQASVVKDKATGDSKGFGFIEMPDQTQAEEAIRRLDGQPFQGRNLRVNPARPKTDARPRRAGQFGR